jgi:SAM-dependent methyltransferase
VSAAATAATLDAPSAPLACFDRALAGGGDWRAREADGATRSLPVGRWLGEATPAERRLLDRADGPVLDVGCGPGRHLAELRRRRVPALGIDVSAAAVALARRRGGRALRADVLRSPLPGAGEWGAVLLLDGNLGIGGDPAALLGRVRPLLAPGGALWVELAPPPARTATVRLRFEGPAGESSGWFAWAHVAAAGIETVAGAAGLRVDDLWRAEGRWFAQLSAHAPARSGAEANSATPSSNGTAAS